MPFIPEPFVDIPVEGIPEIRQLGKIKPLPDSLLKGRNVTAKISGDGLAGCFADQGDVDGHQKMLKSDLSALLDCCP